MHSKKSGLLLSHLLFVVALSLMLPILDDLLRPLLGTDLLRRGLLVAGAALLYLFFAPSIIDPFLQTDEKLKEMIDHTLHELNTPIATIEANTAMLRRSLTDPKALKRLDRIAGAAADLGKLYARIEYDIKENIEHITRSRFHLKPLITHSLAKFEEIRGDIALIDESADLILFSDPDGFARMLDNLISNAIKYNRPGGFVRLYTEGTKLCIEDSGIGIDPKNLFIVYEKSFQENPTTEGYGLGLSIVKNFCDREKIIIKIDTRKGEGTTFSLDLVSLIDK